MAVGNLAEEGGNAGQLNENDNDLTLGAPAAGPCAARPCQNGGNCRPTSGGGGGGGAGGGSGGPPAGFGWYTDSGGQSCDDVCAGAGTSLTCSADRPGVVDSEASFIAINQCLVARGGAGFSCGSYSEQNHHLMPGQYGDGGQCNYVSSGTTFVRCDGSHPNDQRLCCCVGIGEDPSTACPQMPTDCDRQQPEYSCVCQADFTGENCEVSTAAAGAPPQHTS